MYVPCCRSVFFIEAWQGAKDAPAPRPNKRPRTGPSPQDSKPSSSKLAPIPSKKQSSDKKPAQLDEFIEAYKPKKLPLWANEMQPEPSNVVEEEPEPVNPVAMSDLDWMKSRVSTAVDATDQPAFFQSDDEDVTSDKVERPEVVLAYSIRAESSSLCSFPNPQTWTQPETQSSKHPGYLSEISLSRVQMRTCRSFSALLGHYHRQVLHPFLRAWSPSG